MNLSDAPFAPVWYLLGWAGLGGGLWWALRGAPWRRLLETSRTHVWLATVVALALMWQMRAEAAPGLYLHMLGAMVLLLESGAHLAFIGLLLVQVVVAVNEWLQGGDPLAGFGLNATMLGLLPVLLSWLWVGGVRRWAPRHLFVYIFANGFFGAGVSAVLAGAAVGVVLAIAGAYPVRFLMESYWPYVGLLGFAEAWLTGLVVTLLVVYRPRWLAGFDARGYLRDR